MMTVLSIFVCLRNVVLMSIALRFHLFDPMRVIATCTFSQEQVGDSVFKLSTSLNPLAHSLAIEEFFPSTSFCLRTQCTDIVGWP